MNKLANVVFERGVLAGICRYGSECYYDISDIINDNTFTVDYNKNIYRCIKHSFDKGVENPDLASIIGSADEIGLHYAINEPACQNHLQSLFNFPVDKDNIRTFAQKIRKLEIIRLLRIELDNASDKLLEFTGDEAVSKIFGVAEECIFDFSRKIADHNNEPKRIDEDIEEYIEYLATNPVDQLGIPTGFTEYDKMIGGGLRGSAVDVVAARSKAGKSIFAMNVGYNIASDLKLPVLVCDSEMKYESHLNRLLAKGSDNYTNDIETGKFAKNPMSHKKVKDLVNKIKSKEIPYYHICVNAITFDEQLSIMRRWIHKYVGVQSDGKANKCVLIYDYLKLTSTEQLDRNLQEYQLLGFMMIKLHEFACKYDVPILMMLQTNRDGLSKEDASIASGGDRIIFNCSSFSLLKEKSQEEIDVEGLENGNRKLINILSRYGGGVEYGNYLNCYFNGAKATIVEGKTRRQLALDKKKEEQDEVQFN